MVDTKIKNFTDANRQAWNEAEPHHRSARFEILKQRFASPGYNYLSRIETWYFQKLGIKGKSVAQIACNNGRDILSVKNLGAGRCVGFDISDAFIEQGKELTRQAGKDCELVVSDAYQVPDKYNAQFDLVFISKGALIVMPELVPLFAVFTRLLKPGGQLFIMERHPILDMYNPGDRSLPPKMVQSYFDKTPGCKEKHFNYWTKDYYDGSPMYTFHHKMSDIINAGLRNKFRLIHFEEYQIDLSEAYRHFQELTTSLPLSYALIFSLET